MAGAADAAASTAAIRRACCAPDGTLAAFTAVCAPTVYRGDRLPAELYGNVFVAEPAAQPRQPDRRDRRRHDAARHGRRTSDGEFIASTDERFRPVYLSSAPDGTLYVVDMYRGIIQHRGYITEYLRDQILSRKLEAPIGTGPHLPRRARHDAARTAKPSLSTRYAGAAGRGAARIRTAGGATRRSGCWSSAATVGRAGAEKLAESAAIARTRLHALWTLDGLDGHRAGDGDEGAR